jgi:hypothetical protein
MAESETFSVRYDGDSLKSARWRFALRWMLFENTWPSYFLCFGIVLAAGLSLFARDLDFLSGLACGVLLAIVAYLVIALSSYRARVARSARRVRQFTLTDDAIELRWEENLARYPWSAVQDVWKYKGVWLLMMTLNDFVALPLDGVPRSALELIDRKVAKTGNRT